MEEKIKELLKESAESKKTVMEAWILFLVAAFVLVGVLFREQIQKWFKEETPETPKEEEPEEEEPEQPEPEEPEEPSEDPSDPIEEPELPPVDQPEEPDEKEEKPIPIPEPEPQELQEPTKENPFVCNILFNSILNFKWLPVEGAEEYHLGFLKKSWVIEERELQGTEYSIEGKNEGKALTYGLFAVKNGERTLVGRADTVMPELPNLHKNAPLPERGKLPKGDVYELEIPDTEEDFTDFIQDKINAIPDGTPESYSIVKFKSDRKKVSTQARKAMTKGLNNIFNIFGRSYLVFMCDEGEEFSFFAEGTETTFFRMHKSNNIIFRNIHVENTHVGGYESSRAFEHGFDSHTCSNIRYEYCSANGTYGDGIYGHETDVLEIFDCYINEAGRQGAAFSDFNKNIKIYDTKIKKGARAAVDFECDFGGSITNVDIKDCVFDNHISAAGIGVIENVSIDNCKVDAFRVYGDPKYPRKNWKVTNCEDTSHYGSPKELWAFRWVHNLILENNKAHIAETQSRRWIQIKNCTGTISIKNNDSTNPAIIELTNMEDAMDGLVLENNTPQAENGMIELDSGEVKPQILIERK